MKRWILILCVALFTFSGVFSQEYNYRHFGVREGLPSSEVYHVFQDSKGYIWLATDMGVSRYDGYEFRNFDSEDGLPDNTVFEIYEDYKGRIWFVPISYNLSYFLNDSIHLYEYNSQVQIAKRYFFSIPGKFMFEVDTLDNIYCGTSNRGHFIIDSLGVIKKNEVIEKANAFDVVSYGFEKVFSDNLRFDKSLQDLNINTLINKDGEQRSVKQNYKYQNSIGFLVRSPDDKIAHSRGSMLFVFDREKIFRKRFNFIIISLGFISEDILYLGTLKQGLKFYSLSTNKIVNTFLEGHDVTSFISDREEAFWFSTLNNGVYYLSKSHFGVVKELREKNIVTLKSYNKSLLIGVDDPSLRVLENQEIKKISLSSNIKMRLKYLFFKPASKELLIGTTTGLFKSKYRYQNSKFYLSDSVNLILNGKISHANYFVSVNKNSFIVGNSLGTYKSNVNQIEGVNLDGENIGITECACKVDSGIFIGGSSNVYKYINGKLDVITDNSSLFNNRIKVIEGINSLGEIWFGTKGAGIIRYGDKVSQFTKQNGLSSNFITCILPEDSVIWVGTNNGLNRILLDKSLSRIKEIDYFHEYDGLLSNEVTNLEKIDSVLYIGTKFGLSKIDVNKISVNTVAPQIYIDKVLLDNKEVATESHFKISPEIKVISIKYTGLNYRLAGDITYRYMLSGIDTSWVYTKNREIQFTTLPPRKYTFKVQAQNEDEIWSTDSAELNFEVLPKVWQTKWFIALSVIFFFLITFLIYRRGIRLLKKKSRVKLEMLELRQSSLRQQMNPHFIFNTLNSIQLFVLNNDSDSSYKYLVKFAKLMRLTLENSQHSLVSLKEELKLLKIYVELEDFRFDKKIGFELNVRNNEALRCLIPTFLIQPFVENAIWHGLMPKKTSGKIQLSIDQQNEKLIFSIKDDGVGRNYRQEVQKKKVSLGVKIVKERLELLSTVYQKDFSMEVIDLIDDFQEPAGTLVRLIIPIIHKELL